MWRSQVEILTIQKLLCNCGQTVMKVNAIGIKVWNTSNKNYEKSSCIYGAAFDSSFGDETQVRTVARGWRCYCTHLKKKYYRSGIKEGCLPQDSTNHLINWREAQKYHFHIANYIQLFEKHSFASNLKGYTLELLFCNQLIRRQNDGTIKGWCGKNCILTKWKLELVLNGQIYLKNFCIRY